MLLLRKGKQVLTKSVVISYADNTRTGKEKLDTVHDIGDLCNASLDKPMNNHRSTESTFRS